MHTEVIYILIPMHSSKLNLIWHLITKFYYILLELLVIFSNTA